MPAGPELRINARDGSSDEPDVEAIQNFFAASPSLIHLCMGVCVTLGSLHWWMAQKRWDENGWIALWAGLAFLFLGARGIQLTTREPMEALVAGKVCFAIAPFMVWCLVGFARRLNGGRMGWRLGFFFSATSISWALLILGTSWFVSPEITERTDAFGRTHLSVAARWPTALLGVYIGGVIAWGARRLRKSSTLEKGERRVLLGGLYVYAGLGIAAVLSGIEVISAPAVAEYGPFILAVCLSYLLVKRRRRLEEKLERLVQQQTSRLAASEARYRDLVEHAPIAILACDLEGRIRTTNARMLEMVGAGSSDPAHRVHVAEVQPLAAAGLPDLIEMCLDKDSHVTAEMHLEPPYGSPLDLRVSASPLRDEDHQRNGVLFLFEDVTEKSALEQKLRQSQKMEALGELASGIAHEINNPMAYVRANLGIMGESWSDLHKELGDAQVPARAMEKLGDFESLIEESMEGVERTIAIATDMREFAHAGSEQRGVTELREILEASVRLTNAFRPETVSIHENYGNDLVIRGAHGPLRQVFLNLLVNGLQAIGPHGEIWIEAERKADHIRVRIHDNGPGVPLSARDRLFDPFFTTKPAGEGTGLGLYISYQIIRSHDGEILVDDGPEGGACFEVQLPILPSTGDDDPSLA